MKIKYSLLLILVSIALSACETIIEFKGDEVSPRLVLFGEASVGNQFEVNISNSLFFLTPDGEKDFTSCIDTAAGHVRLFVNGSEHPLEMAPLPQLPGSLPGKSPYRYCSEYVPATGDHIEVEADFPGFARVTGTTDVPGAPLFEIVDVKSIPVDSICCDVTITVRLHDDGSYSKCYFFSPERHLVDTVYGIRALVQLPFETDDPLFIGSEGGLLPSLFSIHSPSNMFTDILPAGKDYDFTVTVRSISDELFIEMRCVTDGYYQYHLSLEKNSSTSGISGMFGEASPLFSDVEGGIGCICSSVSVITSVEYRKYLITL